MSSAGLQNRVVSAVGRVTKSRRQAELRRTLIAGVWQISLGPFVWQVEGAGITTGWETDMPRKPFRPNASNMRTGTSSKGGRSSHASFVHGGFPLGTALSILGTRFSDDRARVTGGKRKRMVRPALRGSTRGDPKDCTRHARHAVCGTRLSGVRLPANLVRHMCGPLGRSCEVWRTRSA